MQQIHYHMALTVKALLKRRFCLLLISLLIGFTLSVKAQHKEIKPFVSEDIFKTAYFIENKGQFDKCVKTNAKIAYAIDHNTDHIYFHTDCH